MKDIISTIKFFTILGLTTIILLGCVRANGHGKLTSPTGEELYLGMYKEGKQTIGYGYYNWQGNRYFGELKNGIPNGYGVLIWMGEKIFGEFRNMKIWKET